MRIVLILAASSLVAIGCTQSREPVKKPPKYKPFVSEHATVPRPVVIPATPTTPSAPKYNVSYSCPSRSVSFKSKQDATSFQQKLTSYGIHNGVRMIDDVTPYSPNSLNDQFDPPGIHWVVTYWLGLGSRMCDSLEAARAIQSDLENLRCIVDVQEVL